ncbi:site-specific integrase [Microbacterium pumilum]|uniref:Site-specific integrase n=1 Tax=Microbacterium pumilum TaxID=344165 RepID=A0ABN2T2G8_9MICO
MASVREVQRADGIAYEARWRDNGKYRQRTFTVKREAERFAYRIENELADGQSTDALVKNAKRFREVADAMLDASKKLKPKTRRGLEDALKLHIHPTFGDRRINTITSLDVEAWLADLEVKVSAKTKEPLSASTRRGIVIALSKVFRYALKHRLINANPCAVIDKPTARREEPIFLTPAEVAAIMQHVGEREPVYALVVRFAAYSGVRPGELEALRIRDINFMHRHVEVRRQAQFAPGEGWSYITPKSQAGRRDVPLSASLLLALREHIAAHPYRADPDALLWPGRRKGGHGDHRAPLSYDAPFRHESVYRSYVQPAMIAAGIEPVVWYAFRHYFASACAAAGYSIHDVAKWMGHSNIQLTYSTYMHLFVGTHDMDRLDALSATPPVQAIPLRGVGGMW